ncbi:hypothetical protein Vretimale_17767 [Volvox reticuliferus]|uniref:Uncharacterized protein n=1 Tax=Volvox reticuliferus TaxID=1737510 RepID=A0A8J4GVZ4_9CHLO|nr:hypothetical protein Vretifemale_1776 [Volvox reticuliferus]GIM14978.1 hypothetical protein Vretimale_17767 [Volvox reticuliferus]
MEVDALECSRGSGKWEACGVAGGGRKGGHGGRGRMDDTRLMGTKGNSALVYTSKVRRRDEAAERLMITQRRKEEDFAVRQRTKPRRRTFEGSWSVNHDGVIGIGGPSPVTRDGRHGRNRGRATIISRRVHLCKRGMMTAATVLAGVGRCGSGGGVSNSVGGALDAGDIGRCDGCCTCGGYSNLPGLPLLTPQQGFDYITSENAAAATES